jgi:hypothetical protein
MLGARLNLQSMSLTRRARAETQDGMHSRMLWAVGSLVLACAVGCRGETAPESTGSGGATGGPPGTMMVGVGVGGANAAGNRAASAGAGVAGQRGPGMIGTGVAGKGAGGMPGAAAAGGMATATAGMGAAAGTAAAAAAAGTGAAGTPGAASGKPHGGSEPVTFEKNIKLNDDSGRARQTEVALASGPNGLVIAGWMDERAERTCSFSWSSDNGVTWSKNVVIENTANFVGDPAVAVDGGGNLYAVCQQYINAGSTGQIKMMTSKDKGATWGEVQMIQSAPDKPWLGGGVESGVVFVSWLGNPGGIKRSVDMGVTWEATQTTGNIVHGTAITTSTTGLVHVPYNADSDRNQLRYLRSKDNGKTWDQRRDLLPDMGRFCFQCQPRQHPIVGAGSDPTGKFVAITWASTMSDGEGDDDVWVLYSKDGGETWTDPIKVADNTMRSRQFEPWVAVDAYGRVHVAWTDYRNGGENATYYARSADPEKGFEKNVEITEERGNGDLDFLGDYKGIVVSGEDVIVVWQDTRADSGDIYIARAIGAAGPP